MAVSLGAGPSALDDVVWRPAARSPIVGRYNRGLVLEAIRLHPDASRVELAKITGLTSAAVSNIVRGLMNAGLVMERGVMASRGGKPGVRLRIRPRYRHAIGVHLRPDSIGVVLADLDGTIIRHHAVAVSTRSLGPEGVLGRASAIVQRMIKALHISKASITGVGLAAPGPVDHGRQRILRAPNLPGWEKAPLADLLQQGVGHRVTLVNDANASAIGEKWVGSARDIATFLYMYLGIGIGGAIFIDHRLYRGLTFNAGAVGHLIVDPSGPVCGCGNRGCLEAIASPAAMVGRAAAVPGLSGRLQLTLERENTDSDHAAVLRAAAAGDREVIEMLSPVFDQLGSAVASLVNVLDVGQVIIGGPAVDHGPDLYLGPIQTAVATKPIARQIQSVGVRRSDLGERGAVVGAAAMIFQEAYGPNLMPAHTEELNA